MEQRYEYAKEQALKAALPQHQKDVIETLDICMRIAVASENDGITTGRAIEVFGRLKYYLDCLDKFYALQRGVAEELKNAKITRQKIRV